MSVRKRPESLCSRKCLVADNLNTYYTASFYMAFPSEIALKLMQKFEFHYTPKHRGTSYRYADEERSQCFDSGGVRMREKETMGSKQRIHNIDIIKGVCILFVITEHALCPALKANILFPFWGKQAVPVFMLLSGYLYALSFEKGRHASFLTLWSAKRIVNQILRYSVPFFCFYFVESVATLVANGVSKIPDILTLWIRGGGARGVLLSAIDTVGVSVSIYLLGDKEMVC